MKKLILLASALLLQPTWAAKTQDIHKLRYQKTRALERVKAKHEAMIPESARRPDGGIDESNPQYQKVKKQWSEQMEKTRRQYDGRDARWREYEKIRDQAGLTEKSVTNTGSKPKSLHSDLDLTPDDYAAGRKLVKAFDKNGIKVKDLSDRWVVPGRDITVWKPTAGKDAAGGSAYEAGVHFAAKPQSDKFPTEGGLHSTSGGKIGTEDPRGAVLANIKKASDGGVTGDPSKMDLHIVGKSASKAMGAAGTEKANPDFIRKANAVRSHLSPEEAGIAPFGASRKYKAGRLKEFQEEALSEINRAYDKAGAASRKLEERRANQAQALRESGDRAGAARLREDQIRARVSNDATVNELSRNDPRLVKRVIGTDPRTPAGAEKLLSRAQRTAEFASQPHPKPSWNAPVKGPGEAAQARQKWGGRSMMALGILAAGAGAMEKEMEDAVREGREPSKVRAAGKMLGETLWGLTGIPTVTGMAERAGQLRDEELNKADARYGDKHLGFEARIKALGRMGLEIANWDTGSQIAREEMLREERIARSQNREPSYLSSTLNGFARGLGSVVGISAIADFASRDWGAEMTEARQGRMQRAWAQARFQEGLDSIKSLQADMLEASAALDPYDPSSLRRIQSMSGRYGLAREALLQTAQSLRRRFGAQDPQVQEAYQLVASLPQADSLTQEIVRQSQDVPGTPRGEEGSDEREDLLSEVASGTRRAQSAQTRRRDMLERQKEDSRWADDTPSSSVDFFQPVEQPGSSAPGLEAFVTPERPAGGRQEGRNIARGTSGPRSSFQSGSQSGGSQALAKCVACVNSLIQGSCYVRTATLAGWGLSLTCSKDGGVKEEDRFIDKNRCPDCQKASWSLCDFKPAPKGCVPNCSTASDPCRKQRGTQTEEPQQAHYCAQEKAYMEEEAALGNGEVKAETKKRYQDCLRRRGAGKSSEEPCSWEKANFELAQRDAQKPGYDPAKDWRVERYQDCMRKAGLSVPSPGIHYDKPKRSP